ncbi:alpha/beta hydrolase [Chromatiaceae bacterium AAb-1]|nr:alpha/beta hydrolase [Chromatiaceae bacterium AAb-1]
MQLIPWSYATDAGFTLRGHYTPPSGKPVLHFLHGNGFCSRIYEPMLEHLTDIFDLFLSDAQGHGDSDHGGAFIGWNKSAELAGKAWTEHKNIFGSVPVFGAGHSFGGILTSLLHASPSSPFKATVLLDPILFTPTMLLAMSTLSTVRVYHKNPMAKAALRRRQHWPDRAAALTYLTGRGMFKGWHPAALNAYIEHAMQPDEHGLTLKCRPQREAEVFSSYPEKLWYHLSQPSNPVHVIYGEQSYPFIEKSLLKWQKKNSAISITKTAGGHCFMQEYPDIAANKIRQVFHLL